MFTREVKLSDECIITGFLHESNKIRLGEFHLLMVVLIQKSFHIQLDILFTQHLFSLVCYFCLIVCAMQFAFDVTIFYSLF